MDPYGISVVSGIESAKEAVYFSKTWVKGDKFHSSIFSVDSGGIREVTHGGRETSPIVSGNSLYYISREQDVDRVMKLESMSEPSVVCKFRRITSYVPYGDGALVVVSENFKSTTPFVIRRLRYKHDSTGLLRRRRSLYYASPEGIKKLSGPGHDISDVKVSGGRVVASASWISDDLSLTDLFEVDVKTGEMKKITSGRGQIDAFAISGSGKIAYVGHRSSASDWATRKLYLPESGQEYAIAGTAGCFSSSDLFDDSGPEILWNGSSIYVTGQSGGETAIYSISDGKVERVTPEGICMRHFSAREGRLSYSYSTTSLPSMLVTPFGEFNISPGSEGREAEKFVTNGVEGWAMITDNGLPSILVIHGGPHSAFGPAYNIEIQYLAHNGYNVLYCNPRGSMGYGEEFARGSVGKWGEGDCRDIMDFLSNARAKYNLTGKVGVKGISYGGYMVNWLVTQTKEFSAAVSEKGVSNLLSSCGTSDIGYWFDAPEEIGTNDPWSPESLELFMKKSPITYVKNARTPTLLIHGEEDHRCPIEQSEQFFTALKFYGVDTVFIRLPGESHELENRENPVNRAGLFLTKKEWFDKYLKGIEANQKHTSQPVKL